MKDDHEASMIKYEWALSEEHYILEFQVGSWDRLQSQSYTPNEWCKKTAKFYTCLQFSYI